MSNHLNDTIQAACSPVIFTVSTDETERICLKNGLALHELLAAFFALYQPIDAAVHTP